MRARDVVAVAAQHISETRVFFLANVIAISVGVLLIVVMLSMSRGISTYVNTVLQKEACVDLIDVTIDPRLGHAAPLDAAGIATFRRIPGVRQVTPMVGGIFADLVAPHGADSIASLSSTVGVNDPELKRLTMLGGSAPRIGSGEEVLIPESVARELGFYPPAAAVHRAVRLRVTRGSSRGEETLELPLVVSGVAGQTR